MLPTQRSSVSALSSCGGRSPKRGPIEHISYCITEGLEITSFSSIRKMEILMAVLCSPQTSFISASQSALKA